MRAYYTALIYSNVFAMCEQQQEQHHSIQYGELIYFNKTLGRICDFALLPVQFVGVVAAQRILFWNFNLHIDRAIYNLRHIKLTSFITLLSLVELDRAYAHIVKCTDCVLLWKTGKNINVSDIKFENEVLPHSFYLIISSERFISEFVVFTSQIIISSFICFASFIDIWHVQALKSTFQCHTNTHPVIECERHSTKNENIHSYVFPRKQSY